MNNPIKRTWKQGSMVNIEDLRGMTFQAESGAHTFVISAVDDNNNSITLSGTPSGTMLRPDNTDQALTCSVSDGKVYATLPAGCYDVPGRAGITIFLTSGGQKTAIYAAVVSVTRTQSGTASPGTTASVVDLVNAIAAAVATIPASYTDLMASIAPTYSSSGLYAVGSYAWYNGKLYRCTTAITTAETWTAAHWTLANLGSNLADLKSALSKTTENVFKFPRTDDRELRNGTLFTHYPDNSTIDIRGTVALGTNYIINMDFTLYTGKSYKCFIISQKRSGTLVYQLGRVNKSTSASIGLIANGDVFTPSVDETLVLSFTAGNTPDAIISFYIAEVDNVNNVYSPNFTSIDHLARNKESYDIASCKDIIEKTVDVELIELSGNGIYRINTSGETVDVTQKVISTTSTKWWYSVVDCEEGDKFVINGTGGNAYRLWCFIDSSGNVLQRELVTNADRSNYIIIAPTDSVKLVINTSRYAPSWKVIQKRNTAITETENLFFFNNVNSRTLLNAELRFPNDSTIEISTGNNTLPSSGLPISSFMNGQVLKAGTAYVYYRYLIKSGIQYAMRRINAKTGEQIGALLSGDVFTPSVDETLQLVFSGDVKQNGSVMFYIAESSKATKNPVPHTTAVDYIARLKEEEQTNEESGIDYSYNIHLGGYIDLSGETADINSPVTDTENAPNYCYAIVPCSAQDRFEILAYGHIRPRTWGFVASNGSILSVANPNDGSDFEKRTALKKIVLSAPQDSAYLVVNHYYKECGYTPRIVKGTFNYNGVKSDWRGKVIAAYNRYIAVYDNHHILLSDNCGGSFRGNVDVTNIDGIIKSCHFYNNGCLAFFTHKTAYYIESDWTTYSVAQCYESDGETVYTPATYENFYTIFDYKERKVVNGQDWYVFGNYVVVGDGNTRVLIWCSTDNGHSYKIIQEFGSGFQYSVRHVHSIVYYEPDDTFIVSTGDGGQYTIYVFLMRYRNGGWTLEVAGTGNDYFWACLDIYDGYIYAGQDFAGTVLKMKYEDISDPTKHEVIFRNEDKTGAIRMAFGERGDAIVTVTVYEINNTGRRDTLHGREVYYTSDRKTFFKVVIPPLLNEGYTALSKLNSVTSDGHFICGIHHRNTGAFDGTPSIFIDEYVKNAGFPDALKPAWVPV